MNDNEITARIRQLMHSLNLRQNEFAARIGVNNSNLSKYLNGRLALSESLINKIVVSLGVPKPWLVDGIGSPQPLDGTSVQTSVPPTVPTVGLTTVPSVPAGSSTSVPTSVPTVQVDSSIRLSDRPLAKGTPVYDIDVTAGPVPRSRMFSDDLIIGYINLPQIDEGDKIVSVSGDSMAPVIKNGDLVAVHEIFNKDIISWGDIYVVLTENFRLVKYLRRHPDPAMVILRSENKNYDDIDLRRTDILDMMIVKNILHFDRRL